MVRHIWVSIISVIFLLLAVHTQTQDLWTPAPSSTTSLTATLTTTAPPTSAITTPPTYVDIAQRNNRDWRESSSTPSASVGCDPLTISSGYFLFKINNVTAVVIVSNQPNSSSPTIPPNNTQAILLETSESTAATAVRYYIARGSVEFTPHCPDVQTYISNGKRPVNNTNIIEYQLGLTPFSGSFYNSVFPTCACLSVAMVIIYCTLLILIMQFHKRPLYQLFTVAISAVTITTAFVHVTKILSRQANAGYFDGPELTADLASDMAINILLPINSFFLTMAQVHVLFRVFERRREKIVVFWFGLSLAICLAVLWGISIVYDSRGEEISEREDALTVFSYLFKIANSIMFSGCIIFFGTINYKVAYRPEVLILAILALACSVSPIVLFIQDILTEAIDQWADFADIITLMMSSIVSWEWIERVHGIRRRLEYQSVLGRQYYEEDDELSIVVHNNNSKNNNNKNSDKSNNNFSDQTNNSSSLASTVVVMNGESVEKAKSSKSGPDCNGSPVSWGYSFVKEWLKNPIRRPDTTSSTQTVYFLTRTKTPHLNSNDTTATQQNIPDQEKQNEISERSNLPKIYHDMPKHRDDS
ncbi:conserved hypothetical protein. Putative pH signal transduction protein PalH [Geotrichum candidum]|uniref:pH-response regulator protein palH/RIM21 n=1 Tax=Geotrichum candidum TaxID=1173061 RepID=A0A0J9XH95_GEOCN|nr:conserved hypothetical protein. Putative pH signal transduction protein PalH [Geotrichum candidum]